MKRLHPKHIILFAISLASFLLCQCSNSIPTNPYAPQNTKIEFIIKSLTLSPLPMSTFTDTLGTTIRVGVVSNIPSNIDTAIVKIISAKQTFDTSDIFSNIQNAKAYDTAWFSYALKDTGEKTISLEAHIHGWKVFYDTVILKVYARINHPPRVVVTGTSSVSVGQLCSLSVVTSDPDAGQKLVDVIENKPELAQFDPISGIFKWIPSIADTGVKSVLFRVIDDGFPLMSDSQSVAIKVSYIKINMPPKWQQDTINIVDTVGKAINLTLSTYCTDPDADPISFSLLTDKPDVDSIINGMYAFLPTASDIGVFWPRIVAKDLLGLSDTVTLHLTVLSSAQINHKPLLEISGARNLKSGTTCMLTASATDPDSTQTLTYSMIKKPAGSTFNQATGIFTWATPAAFKGTDTAIFKVVDNGTPIMSDSVIVAIFVSDTLIIQPPKWQSDTIALSVGVGSALTLTLADKCVDPNGYKVAFSLLNGKPVGDTIKTGVYSFTPAASDTGIFWPSIVAKDSAGLADTLTLRLNVTAGDRTPPELKFFSPATDSAKVNTSSISVQLLCKDQTGIAFVKCQMVLDTFAVTHADSVYSATITGLQPSKINEILFIATDKSIYANCDTLKLHVKFDNDSEPPKFSRFDPLQDSISISANSSLVKVVCKDLSGISSFTCKIGTSFMTTSKINDSVWSANVSGLVQNQFNKIIFIAADGSLKANRDTFTLAIKYDPTMEDKVAPMIVQVSSLPVNMVVSDSIIVITDSLYDQSGVDSVYWTLNSKNNRSLSPVAVIATGGTYKLMDTLRRYHFDTIDVYARDKATAHNMGTQRIIVNYNVPPVGHDTSVTTILNIAKSIALTAGSPDGDAVTWSAFGTPAHGTMNVSGATVTYTPATDWVGPDSFTVKVFDGFWSDTAKIKVTTNDNRVAPKNVVIIVNPASDTVIQGRSLSMSVTMNSDVNPAPTYQWFKDNNPIGAASTYSISAATMADAGNYKITVSNTAGSTTSSEVKITVLPTYTLTVNRTAAGGTVLVQKDTAVYVSGASVKLTATPAAGYRFLNWSGDTSSTVNPLTVIMLKNRTITANYKKQYTLTLASSDLAKGTVSSTAGTSPFAVDSGTAIPIAASPISGYKFKQWSTTATGVVLSSTTATNANVTLNQGNATVQGSFGVITFKKQLSFSQYSNMDLKDAVQTGDGGYLIVGRTGSNGNALLIKLNQQGDTSWTKVDNNLVGVSTIRKAPSGFLVSGSAYNSITVNCYAQNGNSLWTFSPIVQTASSDAANVSVATRDNGYVVGGETTDGSSWLMLKTNSVRSILWDTVYSQYYSSGILDCIQSRDGGYVFVGIGNTDLSPVAVKTNDAGAIVWEKNPSSVPSFYPAKFQSIDTSSDGGYIVCGSGKQNGQKVGFIVEISSNGTFGSSGAVLLSGASQCAGVKCLSNGDLMVAGGTQTIGSAGGEDIYIARVSSTGSVLHESAYGTSSDENANSLQLTGDGGAIVVGTNNWVIKTDENGNAD